jgi:two-component system cell cycle response regulator DivK
VLEVQCFLLIVWSSDGRAVAERFLLSAGVNARAMASEKKPLILVADDFGLAREVYVRLVSYAGFRAAEASNGPEAIEKALSLRPQMIIMDLGMPGMDGWEVIRKLKGDTRTKDCRIVVVTGAAYVEGARKAKEAGCDAYLIKPCLPETLLGVVHRLLTKTESKSPRPRS